MVYDFAHPQLGTFHARQFRFKCEMAAEYIDTVIKGKLHRAKNRLMMEGRWVGTVMPPGFMVDTCKRLPDGSENENWKRFVSFEPYAEVVREYYRLFVAHAGNVLATLKHIQEHGPFYPDPSTCFPPEGYKTVYRISRNGNGFCPGRTGLTGLLSNAMYIGHWVAKDVIVRWNNHDLVVPSDLFVQAFNYLSPVTLDGQINHGYRPFREQSRPSKEYERHVERPLCAGMIFGQVDDEKRMVGTTWIKERQHYVYVLTTRQIGEKRLWIKAADFVDEAVVELLHLKLEATFDAEVWEKTVSSLDDDFEKERNRILAQLRALEKIMGNQIAGLDALTNPEMIRAVQKRYEDAEAEFKRLSHDLESMENDTRFLDSLNELRETCGPALENWDNLSRDEKRVILHAFINEIEAEQVEGSAIQIVVYWRDESDDMVILPKQSRNGWREWLPSETKQLLELVAADASQVEIVKTFPNRTWGMIKQKIDAVLGIGKFYMSPQPVFRHETYEVYGQRISRNDYEVYTAHSGDRWTPEDEELLIDLVNSGVSQVELAEAFPYRKWGRIRAKITAICGKGAFVPRVGEIRRDENFIMYKVRLGNDLDGLLCEDCECSEVWSWMAAPMPSC